MFWNFETTLPVPAGSGLELHGQLICGQTKVLYGSLGTLDAMPSCNCERAGLAVVS